MKIDQLKKTRWWRSERRAGFEPHPAIVKMLLDPRAVLDIVDGFGLRVTIRDHKYEDSSVIYWHKSRSVVDRFADELRRLQR